MSNNPNKKDKIFWEGYILLFVLFSGFFFYVFIFPVIVLGWWSLFWFIPMYALVLWTLFTEREEEKEESESNV